MYIHIYTYIIIRFETNLQFLQATYILTCCVLPRNQCMMHNQMEVNFFTADGLFNATGHKGEAVQIHTMKTVREKR